jgi:hypothetical protein
MKKALGVLIGAIVSGFVGAMLTTDFTNMRSNGASYWDALKAGLGAVWSIIEAIVISPWFYLPLAALALILVTRHLTLRTTRPKAQQSKVPEYVSLGRGMDKFVDAISYEKRFRGFSFNEDDPIRLCHEITSFMIKLHEAGLPVPSMQSNMAEEWIDLSLKYFTAVGPLLRNGQLEHAKDTAMQFASRYPPRHP